MLQLNPYLEFGGNCEEAFTFYAECLGGTIEAMMPHAGTPMEEHTDPEWVNKIMHARLNVDGSILMGSDAPPQYRKEPQGFAVSLNLDDPDQAESIFAGLSENGNVTMPIQETFWASRFGMLTDRFGIHWMINCQKPEAEMAGEAAEAGEGEAAAE